MIKTIYDIFISYRRDGGGATAGRINDMLTADGYSVSYDVDTLREGRFDEQLLKRIEQCQDFILVVDKNCYARTIDPATNPKDDWLWQELSYALRLKKNIIPVLLAGASFPKSLPNDIDSVRLSNGPKCVHEYFDSFYAKLKGFLHAYPRMAKSQPTGPVTPTNIMPCLKLKADMDCVFYLDGEEHSHLKAGIIQKIPLAKGEYELKFVSEDDETDSLELEFEMPEVDKFMKVNLREIIARRIFTVNGVSFKMIRVEGGTFMMGATSEQGSEAKDNENPVHQVTLSDYYIGETQVTQELWQTVMDGNNPSEFKGTNRPVECVSWDDCQRFIGKLNELTGKCFRLPTEAEWEFAARGGRKGKDNKYKYSGSDNPDEVAWFGNNSNSETKNVKRKSANELGLYDMSGNVWEWCNDCYGDYPSSPQINPQGSSSGSNRVNRGGSWHSKTVHCRNANRGAGAPSSSSKSLGLRLALF